MDAVAEGLVDYDSPDSAMLDQLISNVWEFSAAKTQAERTELSKLLVDDNGRLRSFNDFKEVARTVVEKYQVQHLKTEYYTAVNSSYLAARWNDFADDDILVFKTAGDSRVRDSHKKLDGISLPKSHPFWRTFYPPLSWNCRCTVTVTLSGRITPERNIPYGEVDHIPQNFRVNLAAQNKIFPDAA